MEMKKARMSLKYGGYDAERDTISVELPANLVPAIGMACDFMSSQFETPEELDFFLCSLKEEFDPEGYTGAIKAERLLEAAEVALALVNTASDLFDKLEKMVADDVEGNEDD